MHLVRKRPGSPVGPDRTTARSPGRDRRQNAALSGPRNLKTAVIGKDGGPYYVRQIRIGAIVDHEGLPCKIVCPKREGIYVKKGMIL